MIIYLIATSFFLSKVVLLLLKIKVEMSSIIMEWLIILRKAKVYIKETVPSMRF